MLTFLIHHNILISSCVPRAELELELDKMRSDLGHSMEEIMEARDVLAREVGGWYQIPFFLFLKICLSIFHNYFF